MKKFFNLSIVAFFLFLLISCGKTNSNPTSSDSTQVADTTTALPIEGEREEGGSAFLSPDLQLHCLRGQVKKVSTTIYNSDKYGHRNFESNKTLLTFDEQGNWTGNEQVRFSKSNFKRNAKGQLTALHYRYIIDKAEDYGYDYEYEYFYNPAGFRIEMGEDYTGELCGSMTHRYSYNEDGEPTVITTSGVGDGVGLEEKIEITVKERDDHGNWICALYKDTSTTTEEYGEEGQTDVSTFTNYSLHVRKIEYYK
ncbi:MAG: hypothetical protein IJT90_00175 [Bacteroidaceae bacterium]|nr:hypothetical protein [Bacteroidaceae bacterium]